jgi:hypothetical protein
MRGRSLAVTECARAERRPLATQSHAPRRPPRQPLPEKMATYGELNLGLAGAIDLCNLPYFTHMCCHSHLIFTHIPSV